MASMVCEYALIPDDSARLSLLWMAARARPTLEPSSRAVSKSVPPAITTIR